jgi:hypothetical protein
MAEEETAEAVAAEEVAEVAVEAEVVVTDPPETEQYDARSTIYTSAVSSAC